MRQYTPADCLTTRGLTAPGDNAMGFLDPSGRGANFLGTCLALLAKAKRRLRVKLFGEEVAILHQDFLERGKEPRTTRKQGIGRRGRVARPGFFTTKHTAYTKNGRKLPGGGAGTRNAIERPCDASRARSSRYSGFCCASSATRRPHKRHLVLRKTGPVCAGADSCVFFRRVQSFIRTARLSRVGRLFVLTHSPVRKEPSSRAVCCVGGYGGCGPVRLAPPAANGGRTPCSEFRIPRSGVRICCAYSALRSACTTESNTGTKGTNRLPPKTWSGWRTRKRRLQKTEPRSLNARLIERNPSFPVAFSGEQPCTTT